MAPTVRTKSFPSSAGTGNAPFDPSIWIIGGGILLAVVIVVAAIFGIRALSSGPAKTPSELNPVPQQTLTLSATGPVDVQVREELDGPIIWRGHMEANDSHQLAKRGKLYLTATEMKNIQIEISGKRIPNPYSGYNRVQIQ